MKKRTKEIDKRIDKIELSADGPFSDAEKAELDQLDEEMKTLNATRRKLIIASQIRLTNSQEINDLIDAVNKINANLTKTRDAIAKVAGTITRINSVLKQVDNVLKDAAVVAKFLAKV